MKKIFVAFIFLVPLLLSAAIGDNDISVAPDGTQLKWDEGNWDFFIMHKTLIDHVTGEANDANSATTNPQGDTFKESSTFKLTSKHIPTDAEIDRAFLVWLSTQDPDNLSGTTDHSVTLTFTNAGDPTFILTRTVTASKQGNLATTQVGNFEYEALNMPSDISGNTGVYTYRVEISDFMKEIVTKGKSKGMESGMALYGDYTVSGMDGSNHQNYLSTSGLVGGWFIPFVYTSPKISTKKIYFYHGLANYHFQSNTIEVSGFKLPDNPVIKLGLVVFEGDRGLANSATGAGLAAEPEGLSVSGQKDPYIFTQLSNDCNPPAFMDRDFEHFDYTEIFNSISSVYGWEDNDYYWCAGDLKNLLSTSNPLEYAMDADVFVVDASPEGPFHGIFEKGDRRFNIKIGANQDQVYTNMLIVSVETQKSETDTGDTDTGDSDTANTDTSDTDSSDSDTGDTDSGDSDSGDSADTDSKDSGDSGAKQGELGGKCFSDGTCSGKLLCSENDNICFAPEPFKKSGGCAVLTVD